MDGDLKAAVEAAIAEVQSSFQGAVEDVVDAAVTKLRDACNDFLGDGDASEAPAAE